MNIPAVREAKETLRLELLDAQQKFIDSTGIIPSIIIYASEVHKIDNTGEEYIDIESNCVVKVEI